MITFGTPAKNGLRDPVEVQHVSKENFVEIRKSSIEWPKLQLKDLVYTSWRNSDEFTGPLVFWLNGVCWIDEGIGRGGGEDSMTAS